MLAVMVSWEGEASLILAAKSFLKSMIRRALLRPRAGRFEFIEYISRTPEFLI